MLSPADRSTLVAIGQCADATDMALAVRTHGASADVLSAILSGCLDRTTEAERVTAGIALARIMLDHPVPPPAAALSGAHVHLLGLLTHPRSGEISLLRAVATYGVREDALMAMFKAARKGNQDEHNAVLLTLSRMIVAAEKNPVNLEGSQARKKALALIGALGAPEHIDDAVTIYGRTRDGISQLWLGAKTRAGTAIVAGLNQRSAVCAAAFARMDSHIAVSDLLAMMKFSGHYGTAALITTAARHAKRQSILINALLEGATVREGETVAGGIRQKHLVCHAVLEALPFGMRAEAPYKPVLEYAGKLGDAIELTQAIEKFYDDAFARVIIEQAAKDAAKLDASLAWRIDKIADIYAKGPPKMAQGTSLKNDMTLRAPKLKF